MTLPANLGNKWAARVEAWLEGLLLLLALAGPAGDLKNALLRRRLGCYVADCAWLSQEKKNRHGKKWADTLRSPPGQPVRWMRVGKPSQLSSNLAFLKEFKHHTVIELYFGVSEQIKPPSLQPIGQAAEFKFESKFEPLPTSAGHLAITLEGYSRRQSKDLTAKSMAKLLGPRSLTALETFPPLFDPLAMRHRAQLISDGVHTFTILHKVQKVHILCLWKFRSDSIVQLARGIPFTNYHCGVPLGLTPVVPLMQFTRTCWPRDNRIIKKGSFGLLFYQLEAAFQEWAHIFQYCGYNIVVTILWLQHCDHDIVST